MHSRSNSLKSTTWNCCTTSCGTSWHVKMLWICCRHSIFVCNVLYNTSTAIRNRWSLGLCTTCMFVHARDVHAHGLQIHSIIYCIACSVWCRNKKALRQSLNRCRRLLNLCLPSEIVIVKKKEIIQKAFEKFLSLDLGFGSGFGILDQIATRIWLFGPNATPQPSV